MTDSGANPTGELVFERRGSVGVATLNRPSALNALTLGMVRALDAQLRAWQDDDAIAAVLLHGAPHPVRRPVFCAGADIRLLHAAAVARDPGLELFFTEEFRLDHLVWTYSKPVIALLDGIVMGGGMGLVQGARRRIVTEHTVMAMPEVGIGFFPDVGGGRFLSRCPGRVGEYLAVTGASIGADDALAWGLADVRIERSRLALLLEALVDSASHDAARLLAIAAADGDSAAPALPSAPMRAEIDRHFGHADVPAIVRSLEAGDSEWAASTLALLRTRSPLMCAVALEQIRRGREMSLADDLRMERVLAHHVFASGQGEAVEGIRALAVDRDRRPRWRHADATRVDPADVAAFFVDPWPVHPLRDLAGPG